MVMMRELVMSQHTLQLSLINKTDRQEAGQVH